jgi:hypothetical protein
MSESESFYYQQRIRRWLGQFDTPIEIAKPCEYWADGGVQWPAVQSQPSSSNLNKHIDVRDQMKQVKFHPHLLPFLLNKFNNLKETATIPLTEETPSPRNHWQGQQFYDVPRKLILANNVAQLQIEVKHMHDAATQLSSILLFLLLERSPVPFGLFPLDWLPLENYHDRRIVFNHAYCEDNRFNSTGRPLERGTVD